MIPVVALSVLLLAQLPLLEAVPASLNEGCLVAFDMELTAQQLAVAGNVGNSQNIFMPPGCTCKESNVISSACVKFDCGCKCDVTAGMCDLNCCCDSECTTDQVSKFFECLDTGASPAVYETCYTPFELESINAKYPMRSDDATESFYKNLLCVQTDNSMTKGIFFDSGTTVTALYPSAADAFMTKPDCTTDFNYMCYNKDSVKSPSSNTNYIYGDSIPTMYLANGVGTTDATAAFGGSLPLPSADSSGMCNDLNAAEFGETTSGNTCTRLVSDAATECASLLDFKKYTEDIWVAKKQNQPYTAAPSADDFENIGIIKVDYTDGTYDSAQGSIWDSGVCKQALKSICYEVRYDANFEIVEIGARLELVDITIGGSIYFEQSYSIEFIGIAPPANAASLENNNFVNRTRSGNPGYIFERPVLAGRVHPSETKAVLAASKGFQIMSAPTGECDTATPMYSNQGQTVGFGVDTSSACTVSLTEAELEALCTGDGTSAGVPLFTYNSAKKMPGWMFPMYNNSYSTSADGSRSKSGLLLGIFGNADPLDKTQWIEVESLDLSETQPTYISHSQTCTGFPTSTHYKIQWTNVGSVTNPQAKIMSAQVEHGTEPMHFMNTNLGVTSAKQKFPFTITVEWQYYELDSEIYSPPPPPIIFSVPYDVFYPFQIDSPAVRGGGRGNVLILLITGGLAIVGALFFV